MIPYLFRPISFPSSWAAVLFALLSLTLASCTPALPIKQPEEPAGFSASGAETIDGDWWVALKDPELDRLIGRALAGNFGLKSVRARLLQAEALARKAGATTLPGLDAEAQAVHRRQDGDTVAGAGDSVSFGLAAAYEIDLWGRVAAGRDAAALDAEASREDLVAAAQSLAAQVAITWYQLVEQRAQLDLLDRQLHFLEQGIELVGLRYRHGQVGVADLLRQRQLIDANRAESAQAEADEKLLEHRLAILLGLSPTETVAGRVAVLADLSPLPKTGVQSELIKRRPDLRSAWLKVLAFDRRAAAALADRFPRIGLGVRISTGGGSGRELFQSWLTGFAAELAAPIFDGGSRRAEVVRNEAVTEEAFALYRQAVLGAVGEVEDALAREERQRLVVDRLAAQLTRATELEARARDRYRTGGLDYLRVLDASLSRQALERNSLRARRQLLVNRIGLYRALAGGLDFSLKPATPFPFNVSFEKSAS